MPPNSTQSDKAVSNNGNNMPAKETYRPMWDEPARRMSIYEWLRGKARDDNIGY